MTNYFLYAVLPYKFKPNSISFENMNKVRQVINRFNDEMYGCINIRHRESTYWSPHLISFTFSKYMVGPRSLAWRPFKVKECVMPGLKALICVKLREKN